LAPLIAICWIFLSQPELSAKPIVLANGKFLNVDDHVCEIGKPGCHAHPMIRMLDGFLLCFEGLFTDENGTFVCFSEVNNGKVKKLNS